MIQAENIYKSYGSLAVLKGVSLHVKKAEIISIVGPSGAGKTTLLQILGTLDKPDLNKEFRLTIEGENVHTFNDKRLSQFRNERIGFIFQFHQLLPEFSAIENVCIPAWIGKRNESETIEKAKELLHYLGLSNRIHHSPKELSGGEQQRVAVARALINNPAIVLADEPSGNLDSDSSELLHKLFFDLRDAFGQTFVVVTHNKSLADMADRKLQMVDGQIVNP